MVDFLNVPPDDVRVTDYDRACFQLYLALLDVDEARVPWDITYEDAFGVKIGKDRDIALRRYLSHLDRACWMSSDGYRQLL